MTAADYDVLSVLFPILTAALVALIAYLWKRRDAMYQDELAALKERSDAALEVTRQEFQGKLDSVRNNLKDTDKRHKEARQVNLDAIRSLFTETQKTMASIRKSLKEESELTHRRLTALDQKQHQFEVEQARNYMSKTEVRQFFKELVEPISVQLDNLTRIIQEIKTEVRDDSR